MTNDTPNLPADVQARLDDHLDKVDAILKRYGKTRTDRSAIVDGLADQIHEMLAVEVETSGDGQVPTLGDLETVLSQIDPPEAYAQQSIDVVPEVGEGGEGEATLPASGFNRATLMAVIWLVWLPFSLILITALSRITINRGTYDAVHRVVTEQPTRAIETWWGIILLVLFGLLGLVAPIGATALGWIGISQIKHSAGREHGLGLAAFCALLTPTLLLATLIVSPAFLPSFIARESPNAMLLCVPLVPVAFFVCRRQVCKAWQKINQPVGL